MLTPLDSNDFDSADFDPFKFATRLRNQLSFARLIETASDMSSELAAIEERIKAESARHYRKFIDCIDLLNESSRDLKRTGPEMALVLRETASQLALQRPLFNQDTDVCASLTKRRVLGQLARIERRSNRLDALIEQLPATCSQVVNIVEATDGLVSKLAKSEGCGVDGSLVSEVTDAWRVSKQRLNGALYKMHEEDANRVMTEFENAGNSRDILRDVFLRTSVINFMDTINEKCTGASMEFEILREMLNALEKRDNVMFRSNRHGACSAADPLLASTERDLLQQFSEHIEARHKLTKETLWAVVNLKQYLVDAQNIRAFEVIVKRLAMEQLNRNAIELEVVFEELISCTLPSNLSAISTDISLKLNSAFAGNELIRECRALLDRPLDELMGYCAQYEQHLVSKCCDQLLRTAATQQDLINLAVPKFVMSLVKHNGDTPYLRKQFARSIEDVVWNHAEMIVNPLRNCFIGRTVLLTYEVCGPSEYALGFCSIAEALYNELAFLGGGGVLSSGSFSFSTAASSFLRSSVASQTSVFNDVMRHALRSTLDVIRSSRLSQSDLISLQVDVSYLSLVFRKLPLDLSVRNLLGNDMLATAMLRCTRPMPLSDSSLKTIVNGFLKGHGVPTGGR